MTHPEPDHEWNALLTQLNSRKPVVREQALQAVRKLTPEDIVGLFRLETQKYRRKSALNLTIQKVSLGVALIQTVYWWMALLWPATAVSVAFLNHPGLAVGLLILGWIGILFPLAIPQRGRRQVATLLGETEDVSLLDAVVSVATDNQADRAVAASGRQALKRLLLKWRPDTDAPFTTAALHALLLPLKSPYDDPDLTLAILSVLGQAGDDQALRAVKQLAEEAAATEKMRRIQKAAQECLSHLQQHLQKESQANTLLRAATFVPDAQPNTLLHPAQPAISLTAPEEMLRMAPPSENNVSAPEVQPTHPPLEEVVIQSIGKTE